MRTLASLLVAVCLWSAVSASSDEQDPYDPLNAHGGIFKSLPWTDFELAKISTYHATVQYHLLMEMVREKLVDTFDDIPAAHRKKIEQFMRINRPPKFMRNMLTKEETEQVRHHHLEKDVDSVLSIIQYALERLGSYKSIALRYLVDGKRGADDK